MSGILKPDREKCPPPHQSPPNDATAAV